MTGRVFWFFGIRKTPKIQEARRAPLLFLRNIKLGHPRIVLFPPFDGLGFDTESTAEGLAEAALGLFGSGVFFGVDPAKMPTAFGQFLE
jgi:hypothetical protein